MIRSATLLATACLFGAADAQQIVWAEGATPTARDVYAVDESLPTAVPQLVLANCELLPIEITCRTLQQGLRDDIARLVVRRGPAHVALPDGGALYRYRRDLGAAWGFLHVAATGAPGVVIEQAGIGANAVDDPFADRIAIAPDGLHAAVVLAGGRAAIMRLDGSVFPSTGTAARTVQVQREFDPVSVAVGAHVAWLMSGDDRVWRVDLTDLAQPFEVTPSLAGNPRTKPEFAPSADGSSAVFLYGPQPTFGLFLVGEQGPSLQLPVPLAKYEEPGYLPEVEGGPKLLLDDRGAQLLYVDATSRDEVFVSDVAGLRSTTQWTGDPNFQPYIGVIVLPFAANDTFVAGIGDPGLFDVYVAASGLPLTQNLTFTAGNLTRPYGVGALVPTAFASFADGGLLTTIEPSGGGLAAAWRFGPTGPIRCGFGLDASIARGARTASAPAADFLLPSSTAGDRLVSGVDGSTVLAVPPGVRLSTSAVGPAGAYRVFLAGVQGARALVLDIPGIGFIGLPANTIDDVLVTPGGSIVLVDQGGVILFGPSGSRSFPSPAVERLVLSGQGTGGL